MVNKSLNAKHVEEAAYANMAKAGITAKIVEVQLFVNTASKSNTV